MNIILHFTPRYPRKFLMPRIPINIISAAGSEVLTAVVTKGSIFWDTYAIYSVKNQLTYRRKISPLSPETETSSIYWVDNVKNCDSFINVIVTNLLIYLPLSGSTHCL
jgi:hypothetical protein